MRLRHGACLVLTLAFALYLGGVTVADTATGVTGVTKGPADVSVPPNVPEGEAQKYGLGFAFQVSRDIAAVAVNLRMEGMGVGDFENGTDVLLFDDLSGVSADAPVPIARNEKWTDRATGGKRIRVKFPDIGGFVPLGAKRADGSRHPYAGSGFTFCEALEFPMNEAGAFTWDDKYLQQVEFHQLAFDGKRFRVVRTQLYPQDQPLMVAGSGWHLFAPGLTMAIPDGDDLLEAVLAQGETSACGVARWRPRYGIWRPVSFAPVPETVGWVEPSLVRDGDGALLFTARGYGQDGSTIRVWRSADTGATWQRIVDVPQVRESSPISINRAADGTPYIATNPLGHGRQVLDLWPLNAARMGLEEPITAREAVEGRTQTVDHPNAATLRLADGKWHHVLAYRVMNGEDPTGMSTDVQTGCCVEEVLSRGPAIPVWQFGD